MALFCNTPTAAFIYYNKRVLKIVVFSTIILVSCKSFVDIDPPSTAVTSEAVFSSDKTSIAVLNGTYAAMSGGPGGEVVEGTSSIRSLGFRLGLLSDELTLWEMSDNSKSPYYLNALSSQNEPPGYWTYFYKEIFMANSVINGLEKSNSVTPIVKSQLIGEALFLRALHLFYLTNLYGAIPVPLTTDYTEINKLGRRPVREVYEQIISDLNLAQQQLSSEFLDGTLLKSTTSRVRPTKWAATALLSRVYLFMEDYANAELESTKVIESNLFSLVPLDEEFLMNSRLRYGSCR
ncbi:RagB/SusD family nutrient uptake outer membrane protein [Pedobacter deserti]|uniref:RagB/SusD family nutrient uptake outer membrane protein n=1 Tax=Pedobacter deserti TaxID=2817382 RepID=UPI00210CC91E|nr:RagB/SusD family nutrient uptake outer membrane protein [Pedobacter sp. SYSU D00382]